MANRGRRKHGAGQVLVRVGKNGRTRAIRYRVDGRRVLETLGSVDEWNETQAEEELDRRLAEAKLGIWKPRRPEPQAAEEADGEPDDPEFRTFALEWLAMREQEGLGERTIEDYRWCVEKHLLRYFYSHRLGDITVREVDRYKTLMAGEGHLSANSVNKTLTRLSQILATAVEYELIPANPAAGRRRRLKRVKPVRAWVEPEQLPTLLDAASKHLAGRGRPLMATLAGTGLRIGEALALERRHVNLARGELTVAKSKTDAGVRVIDLTPALRDELAVWLDKQSSKQPTALVFPNKRGLPDNRHNVRRRLFEPAIEKANKRLAELGIEQIGKVTPHGLRRTYASLRCAAGDDPAFTSAQLGHEDAGFTLRVYTHAVKRRELSTNERTEYDRALEWASWGATLGTSAQSADPTADASSDGATPDPASEAASR